MCYKKWLNCEILQVSKDHTRFRFPWFLPYIIFFFRSQDLAFHFSHYVCLDSSWPWQLLRLFLFLLTLTVLKSSHQAFLENFPQLAFFFFLDFSRVDGDYDFGEEARGWNVLLITYQGHVLSTWLTRWKWTSIPCLDRKQQAEPNSSRGMLQWVNGWNLQKLSRLLLYRSLASSPTW